MNKPQTLLDLFSTQAIQISLPLFVANLLLSALLAWILGRFYVKFGTTLSNREQFGRNFLLVTTTTMLMNDSAIATGAIVNPRSERSRLRRALRRMARSPSSGPRSPARSGPAPSR